MDLKKRPSTKTGFSKNVTRVQLFFFLSSAEISSRVKLLIMLIRSNATQLRNLYIFRFTPAHLNRYFFGQKSVYAIQSAIRIKIFKVKTKDPRTARLVGNFNFFACAPPARYEIRPGAVREQPVYVRGSLVKLIWWWSLSSLKILVPYIKTGLLKVSWRHNLYLECLLYPHFRAKFACLMF